MAKIVITANADKAKRAIDDLGKRIKKLDKDAKKPIRPTVEPRVKGGSRLGGGGGGAVPGAGINIAPGAFTKGAGSMVSQIGGALGIRAAGAMGGGLGAIGNIAAGASMGGAAGALAAAAGQLLASTGEFKGAVEGMKKGIEAILDPQTEMRNRTKYKDTLADKARTHGATMAEQFATDAARSNVFGEVSSGLFDKMGQAVQNAFAGDTKAANALLSLGVNGQMLEGRSLLEQQDIIVQAISRALADIDQKYGNDPERKAKAEAELMTTAREVVGARNMMQLRTFTGLYDDYAGQKAFFIDQYQRMNPEGSDERMLKASRLAEIQETLAEIERNRELDPSLSGYAVEAGYDARSKERVVNAELQKVRGNLTRDNNDYNRAIQSSATYQSALESIDRNTARNNQLMERMLNKKPKQQQQQTDTTATYS